MDQVTLFEEKVASNEIWDAHTIIKNLYNRNVGDTDLFQRYFNFCCMVAGWDIELDTRNYFLDEASTALIVHAENTTIDAKQLAVIKACREGLDIIRGELSAIQNALVQKYARETQAKNNATLKDLAELKGELSRASNQEAFDRVLLTLTEIENQLVKEELTEDQNSLYDRMTKEYSALISDKLTKLAIASNTEYNRNAVKEFKFVFDSFQKNESMYTRSIEKLDILVSSRLFAFDPARLFNETLVYYNHIYSYIFCKLDEDGKFRLTQISIDKEKLLR
ncbi:hypothetical protein HF638_17575 [Paenibacillus sp. SZ31]|uniref:hypothetical protein n=1 Tax=Paenibacillus sp. SZ31 TaxID=2725555 RepID=UPI00146BF999|nr:hypothetical protein [Paenibacillus sp. SZ31]NMI05789.1 hypothetical protein [Paenibacillus sp. SZ31]